MRHQERCALPGRSYYGGFYCVPTGAGPDDARDLLSLTLLDSLGRKPVVLYLRPRSPDLLVSDPALLCRELVCLIVEVHPPLRVVRLKVSVPNAPAHGFPSIPLWR
ncbi:hypothetical protein NDU88_007547 [Pleurodeles waltl]|uniref:Uncharacterized protein n=1 Tax=Pleurodeles waltl TaxID=8319 RepID=A0AAV7ST53_PLEWA|nr:hypothetical protein NDU88_007547 [Pleurodeles waltl]